MGESCAVSKHAKPRCYSAEGSTAIEQHHPGPKSLFLFEASAWDGSLWDPEFLHLSLRHPETVTTPHTLLPMTVSWMVRDAELALKSPTGMMESPACAESAQAGAFVCFAQPGSELLRRTSIRFLAMESPPRAPPEFTSSGPWWLAKSSFPSGKKSTNLQHKSENETCSVRRRVSLVSPMQVKWLPVVW